MPTKKLSRPRKSLVKQTKTKAITPTRVALSFPLPAAAYHHIPHEHFIMALSFFIIALSGVILINKPVSAKNTLKRPAVVVVCQDPDQSNPNIQGTTVLTEINNTTDNQETKSLQTDACVNADTVREYVCGPKGQTITSKLSFCGNGRACSNGACLVSSSTPSLLPEITTPTVGAPLSLTPPSSMSFNITASAVFPPADAVLAQTIISGTHIARFKVSNDSTTRVNITGFRFTDNGAHTGTSTTFRLYASDGNSPNYTGTIVADNQSTLTFNSLNGGEGVTIEAGSYRYFSVAIKQLGALTSGDSFNLSIATLADAQYKVLEADLGYDGNKNGTVQDAISGLFIEGKPVAGTLLKQ